MCLTIPLKIMSIEGSKAKVLNNKNNVYDVDISSVKNLGKGDWILANANIAFKKISSKEAKEILYYYGVCQKFSAGPKPPAKNAP